MELNHECLEQTETEIHEKQSQSPTGILWEGWNRFATTGAVADYLYYAACTKEHTKKNGRP